VAAIKIIIISTGLSWRHFLRKGEGPDMAELDAEVNKRLSKVTVDTVASLVYTPGTEGKKEHTHPPLPPSPSPIEKPL